MVLPATLIYEVETGGSDTANSGGFDPSQTAGMLTDGAATSATGTAPVFSSASYSFVAGDIGAWVFIASGTNWIPGWYKIASVAAGTATLSATAGVAVLYPITPSTANGCATTASPTGATWSIDYSQQSSAQFTYTDLASVGAGSTCSSVANPFAAQQVGNVINVTGGTNFTAGLYVIASVALGVATVVGAAAMTTGAGVSGTGNLGGALATPGKAGGLMIASNQIYIKSGTYTIASATANVATGTINAPAGIASAPTYIQGYGSVRGDYGTKPILIANGSITTFTICNDAGTGVFWENLQLDGNSRTSSQGIRTNGGASYIISKNCTNHGLSGAAAATSFFFCLAQNCTGGAALNTGNFYLCVAIGTIGMGCVLSAEQTAEGCVSINNSGASGLGFQVASGANVVNCLAFGNAQDGFKFTQGIAVTYAVNCISVGNSGYGYNAFTAPPTVRLKNCASYNNTSGNINTSLILQNQIQNFIALTGNPFTNTSGLDFSLNNTTGAGKSLRAAGLPGSTASTQLPGLSTFSYPDIGPVQHMDAGGSSSGTIFQANYSGGLLG